MNENISLTRWEIFLFGEIPLGINSAHQKNWSQIKKITNKGCKIAAQKKIVFGQILP